MRFEHFFKREQPKKKEGRNFEKEGEEIAEDRGGLFAKIIARALKERDSFGQEILEASEIEKETIEIIRKIPVLNGYLASIEATIGVEYGKPGKAGKKLNTEECLIKYGAGIFSAFRGATGFKKTFTIELLKGIADENTDKKPKEKDLPDEINDKLNKIFFEKLEEGIEQREKENPNGIGPKILRAVYEFLKMKKPENVIHYSEETKQAI